MSHLVGNPEDRFSHVTVHFILGTGENVYTDQFMASDMVYESGGDSIGNSPVTNKEECALLCLNVAGCTAATTMQDGAVLVCYMFSNTVTSTQENMVLKRVGDGRYRGV